MIIQTVSNEELIDKFKVLINEHRYTLDSLHSSDAGINATVTNNKYLADVSWLSHFNNGIFIFNSSDHQFIHQDFIFKTELGKKYDPMKDVDVIKYFADEIGGINNRLRHLTSIEINSADEALSDFDSMDFDKL